jgi:hypothetical protein
MADSATARLARVLAQLRRLKPAGIVAIDAMGDESHIAIIGQRGRYERAARNLISINAVSARLVDKDGALLDTVTIVDATETPPAALLAGEELAPSSVPKGNRVDDVRDLVKIALDAADRARARDVEVLSKVIDAAVGVMSAAGERAERLEAMLLEQTARKERELSLLARKLEAASLGSGEDVPSKADELLEKLLGLATGDVPKANGKSTHE